jgi:hypothetical protein
MRSKWYGAISLSGSVGWESFITRQSALKKEINEFPVWELK